MRQSDSYRQRKQTVWFSLLFFLVMTLLTVSWSWYRIVFPKNIFTVSCQQLSPGLSVSLQYPEFLANGDNGEIVVTVTNLSSNSTYSYKPNQKSISGYIFVYFEDYSQIKLDQDTPNLIELNDLKPGEIRTQIIKFSLNHRSQILYPKDTPIIFGVEMDGNDGLCDMQTRKIEVAPLFMLETKVIPFFLEFGVGAISLAVVGLIWDNIKNFLAKPK